MKLKKIFSSKKAKAALLATGLSTVSVGTGITVGINLKRDKDQKEYIAKMQEYATHRWSLAQHAINTFDPATLYQSPKVGKVVRSVQSNDNGEPRVAALKSGNKKGYVSPAYDQNSFNTFKSTRNLPNPKVYSYKTDIEKDMQDWWDSMSTNINFGTGTIAPSQITLADILKYPDFKKWETDFDNKFAAKNNVFISWDQSQQSTTTQHFMVIDFTFEDFILPNLTIRDAKTPKNQPMNISKNSKSVSLYLTASNIESDWQSVTGTVSGQPALPDVNFNPSGKTTNITWDQSRAEKAASDMNNTWKNISKVVKNSSVLAPQTLKLSDVLSEYSSLPNNNIDQTKIKLFDQNNTDRTASGITIPSNTDVINFYLTYPTDGYSDANGTYRFPSTGTTSITYGINRDDDNAKKWFNATGGKLTSNQSSQAPATLNDADILSFFKSEVGGSVPPSVQLSTSSINFAHNVKNQTATVTLTLSDGTTKQTRSIDISYAKTRDEVSAKNWFDGIATTKTVLPLESDVSNSLTISKIKTWLGVANKPNGITGNLSFVGNAPSLNENTKSITFKLDFPVNGVSGTKLPAKTFTINFSKTIVEDETNKWWNNNVVNKAVASSQTGVTPQSISTADILRFINVTKSSKTYFKPLKIYQGISAAGTPITSISPNSNDKELKFTLAIDTNPVGGTATLSKTFTIRWNQTQDEKSISDWANRLSALATNLSGHPQGKLDLNWFKKQIGWNNDPSIGTGTLSQPTVTVTRLSGNLTASNQIDPSSTDNSWTFTLHYKSNGTSSGTDLTKQFTIAFADSQQTYLNGLNVTNTSATSKTGGLLGHYTNNQENYGDIISNIDTSNTPLSEAALKAMSNPAAFTSSKPGVTIDINSVTLNTISSGTYANAQIKQTISVSIHYKKAVRQETIEITYKNADITPFVNQSQMQNEVNKISIGGNTNNATINVPTSFFTYFDGQHLEATIKLNGGHGQKITQGKTTYPIPAGVLQNNESGNSINLTLEVQSQSNFLDPSNNAGTAASKVTKTLSWPIWIDTSQIKMFSSTAQPGGLVGLSTSSVSTTNWDITTTNNSNNSHYRIQVRWSNSANPNRSWVAVNALKNASQIPTNIWDQTVNKTPNGDFKGHLEAQLVAESGYLLSGPNKQSSANQTFFSKLKRVISTGQVTTGGNTPQPTNFFGKIQAILEAQIVTNTDSHNINWGSIQTDLENYATKNNIKISFASVKSPSQNDWTNPVTSKNVATLPVSFNTYEEDRYLHVKVEPINNFQISGNNTYEMAASAVPSIKKLSGWIDSGQSKQDNNNNKKGSGAPTSVTNAITGTTNSANISTPALVKGLKYEFSVDGSNNSWTNQSDFERDIKDINQVKADFKWRVVVTDPAKFNLSTTSQGSFTVSGLKTYVDISSEIASLQGNFSAAGEFGKGKKVYLKKLSNNLQANDLKNKRVKLQYKLTNVASINPNTLTNWTEFPTTAAISGSGIQGANGSSQYVKIAEDLIPTHTSPKIVFRFVPYIKDNKQPVATALTAAMGTFQNDSTAILSNVGPTHFDKNIVLPTVVSVGSIAPSDFTFTTLGGGDVHSKNFTINIASGKDELSNIKAANNGISNQNYWSNLHFIFSIDDGSADAKRYGFLKDDFEKWLHKGFATGSLPDVWEVANGSGPYASQVGMKKMKLPTNIRIPDWNNLDTSSLKVRWATDTTQTVNGSANNAQAFYATSDTSVKSITNFESQVLRWFDASDVLDAVQSVYIEGDTHSYQVKSANKVAAPIRANTALIEDPYLSSHNLVREFSINGTSWAKTLPTYSNDTERQARNLYMRVVPKNGAKSGNDFVSNSISKSSVYIYYPTSTKYAAFNTTMTKPSGERFFKYYVDTSSLKLFKALNTNGYVEILTGQTTKSWNVHNNNNSNASHVKIEVRWVPSNGSATNPFVELENFGTSGQIPNNIWDQSLTSSSTMGQFSGKIEAKLVTANQTDYVLSADQNTLATHVIFKDLIKIIDTGIVVTSGQTAPTNFMGNIQNILTRGLSNEADTNAIGWGSAQNDLEAYAKLNNIHILYSLKQNPNPVTQSDWVQPSGSNFVATLPTSIDTYHSDRYFFIKIEAITGFALEGTGANNYDMAQIAVPKIKQLIGWIDATKTIQDSSAKVGKGAPTQATNKIEKTTNNPQFTMPQLVTGLKYEYSVDGSSASWTNRADFKTSMKAIDEIKANFMWRVVVTDNAKYVLSAQSSGKFTVSNLKTYLDIQPEIDALVAGLSYKGQFGNGQKVYIEDLNPTLSANNLTKKRIKLQYKITGTASINPQSLTDWTDLPSNTTTGSQIAGSKKGSQYIEIAQDLIPGNSSPQIEFRFIPYLDDNKVDISSGKNDKTSMTNFETKSTVVLSDQGPLHSTQTIILPTIVSTGSLSSNDFTFHSTNTNTHTKNFQTTVAKDETAVLTAANQGVSPQPSYWSQLKFIYTINDGSGVSRYGFLQTAFEKWLHGGFSTATGSSLPDVWEIADSQGTKYAQIDMKRVKLPQTLRTPVWNDLDTTSIKVRWATKTTKTINGQPQSASKLYYVASDNNAYALNNFQTQVLKWYDPSAILDAVKSVYITGDTLNYNVLPSNTIQNPSSSNTNYIEDPYLASQNLEREFSIDGSTWTKTKPVYSTETERQQRNLYMRVIPKKGFAPGANSWYFSSTITKDSVYIAYPNSSGNKAAFETQNKDSNGKRYFRFYVDTSAMNLFKLMNPTNGFIEVEGKTFQNKTTKSWKITTNNAPGNTHVKIMVRWVPTSGTPSNPFVELANFGTSGQIPNNIWDQSLTSSPTMGQFTGKIEAKLVTADQTDYVISADRNTLATHIIFKDLIKIINTGSVVTSGQTAPTNFMGKIQNILTRGLSSKAYTNAIGWGSAQNNLEAYAKLNNIHILYSLKQNPNPVTQSDWVQPSGSNFVATLPTSIDTYHGDRYFFIKIEAITGFALEGTGTNDYDMAQTAVPKIKQLIGWIDATKTIQDSSAKVGKGAPTQASNKIEQTTNNPQFTMPQLVTGLKYEYSVDGSSGSWTNRADFKTSMKAIDEIKANFMWRVVVTDNTKYVLSAQSSGKFTVSNLKTYLDIQPEIDALVAGLSYKGQFGNGQKVYIEDLNPTLSANNLTKKRIKLQYKITGTASINPQSLTDWTDLPSNTTTGSQIAGSKQGSQYIEIAQDLIPGNSSPQIEFRFIPYLDDNKGDISSGIRDKSAMSIFETKSTAVLSNKGPSHSIQTIILPTIVSTGTLSANNFSFSAKNTSIVAHSRNFVTNVTNSEMDKLRTANSTITTAPSYWPKLKFIYTISDGRSDTSRYGFLKADFETWLHGDFTTGTLPSVWEVKDSQGTAYSQIDMKRVKLPTALRTPDWNNLDITSLNVQWATETTKTINGQTQSANQLYYVASDTGLYNITNFKNHVLKWYDPTEILNAVKSIYIDGNTNNYTIDPAHKIASPLTSNTSYIDNSYLNNEDLQRQFSIDGGSTWTFSKPVYNTWQERNDRILMMRVVPKHNFNSNNPFISSKAASNSVFLAYPQGINKASFDTTRVDTNGERNFKVYVTADVNELSQVKISGTQFMLGTGTRANEANGLDESIDSNTDDDSVIEIEYQYDGNWYNKQALLTAIATNRTPKTNTDLASITFPSDFANKNVNVRWHLTGDSNNFYLSSQTSKQVIYSAFSSADATLLKNFVNIWNFQSQIDKSLANNSGAQTYNIKYNEPKNNSLNAQGELLTPDYKLTGSLNAATLLLDGNILTPQFLTRYNLKIQYTTAQYPDSNLNGAGWIDATKNQTGLEIFKKVAINNQHKSLWIRIIVDQSSAFASTTVVSSYEGGGNINVVRPVKIDATKMKFLITTDANALKNITMGGTTQAPTAANLSDYFSGKDASPSLNGPGTYGIWYQEQKPGKSILSTITNPVDAHRWVGTNGITIRWQVAQTRASTQSGIPNVNGTINDGDLVEFDDFAQLLAALKTGKLNFDRDSLRVQWGILPSQTKNNAVSDTNWVRPNNFAILTNIIFSRDFVTLTPTSVETTGNTAATMINPTSAFTSLIPTGLQLEYSLDGSSNWSTTKPAVTNPSSIGGDKKLYIRLNPIPTATNTGGYGLKFPTVDDQITQVDNSNVYTAIPLASDNAGTKAASQATWEAYRDTTQVSGVSSVTDTGYTTWNGFAIWTGKSPAKQIPKILPAEDQSTKGHWEYSIDNFKTPHLTLDGAMLDYYGSGTKSFDKDRENHFSMRYVLDPIEKTLANGNAGYTFTDVKGLVIPDASMSFEVDITKLIQYLYIDNPNPILPADQAGNLTNMSWRQLANEPKFRPGFQPAASGKPRYVDYTQMEYKGKYVNNQGSSQYKFDVNPFTNVLDTPARAGANMLAPRHAYFEYSTKQSSTAAWTSWSTTLPIDRPLESNSKYFRIRIVADPGYEIPTNIFAAGDQNWDKEYVVVILKNTEQLSFKSIEYVGFNTATGGEGRIKTDDPNGDFTKGNPLLEINKAGTLWNKYKDTTSSSAFVLEYNVYNNGSPISWIDTAGTSAIGWHSSLQAPAQSKIWYGDMPISLKNGDVVHIRLRAKNGFVIEDNLSTGMKPDGTADYSSEIVLPPVSGLIEQLKVPTTFKVYDSNYKVDYNGNKIIQTNLNMPKLTFAGSESRGTVVINPGSLAGFSKHIKFQVQVLRPTAFAGTFFDGNMKPLTSYQILDNQGNLLKNVGDVWKTATGVWKNDIDYIPKTWVDPNAINWLQVGDSLRIRVVAKQGYGFRWEDPKSSFTDINLTPKTYDQFAHNKNGVLSNTNGNVQGTATPLPVTGLLVKPPKLPSQINLIYSQNPADNIQGNVKNMKTSFADNPLVDKWYVGFRFYSAQSGNWSNNTTTSLSNNLYNGDKVRISIELYSGYTFDPTYQAQNVPHEITIQNLKDMIDMTNTSHPILSFAGYQGQGKIHTIIPSIPTTPFAKTKDANGFNEPKIYSPIKLNGVKWQYQVYESDPKSAAKSSIDLQPWLNTVPKNLKAGWFLRMRVAPNNANDVVLTNLGTSNQPQWSELYSQASYNDSASPAHQKGWVEVVNLKLNPSNIGVKLKVSGFIEKTKVSHEFTVFDGQGFNKTITADEDAVLVEFQNDVIPGKWFNATLFNKTYPKLKNGDKISMRVIPRNTKQLKFDPKDPAIGLNGYSVQTVKGKTYLRNTGWDGREIKGLKKYLDVSRVTLDKPNSILGLGNFESMTPGQQDKVSGQVKLITAVLSGLNTVADVDGNLKDASGKPYSSYVQIEYKIERINPDTGETFPATTSLDAPTKLRNGYKITVELVVTDDTYKLSKSISVVIVVADLQDILKVIEWPKFVFKGTSGKGSVQVSNGAPQGFRWEYVVEYQGKKILDGNEMWSGHSYLVHADKTVTEIEQYTNSKGLLQWRESDTGKPIDINNLPAGDTLNQVRPGAPIDLSNGDLIKARLVSVGTSKVARIQDPNDPSKSTPIVTPKWTTVSGLIEEIDLSGLRIKVWNKDKPYEPNTDKAGYEWTYPFKMVGHQEESAKIVIDASISKKPNLRQLLDTNGMPIKYADKLQWEFAADFSDKVTDKTVWTKTIPQGLKSEQYIHVRFAVRSGVENAVVKNFVPLTFQIPKLAPAQKIDSNVFMFVGIGIGGVVLLGGIAGFVFAIRTRRKLNYRMKPKM